MEEHGKTKPFDATDGRTPVAALGELSGNDAISFVVESNWGFAEVAPDFTIRWVNPAYCAILGAPYSLVLGTSFVDWTHPDDIGIDADLAEKVKTGDIPGYTLRKRYLQYGSTPRRQFVIWGFLSVAGKWKDGEFQGYRVQFRPFNNVDEAQKLKWKDALEWTKRNWKTISTIAFLLTSLIFGGSERLLSILKDLRDAEKSVEQLTQPSTSGPQPQP